MHIKKYLHIYTLTFLLFLSACDGADIDSAVVKTPANNTQIEQQQATTHTSTKHTLWKVEGEKNTVYLLGSIHLMPAEFYPLPNAYYQAFEDAEKLVFEIDDSILDQALMQQAIMKYAPLPQGKRLVEVVGEDTYAEIKQLAKANKVPMLSIEPFDPWFSGITLTAMQYLNAGLSPESGIDQHFMQKGLKAGKPILGLETAEQQFQMFDTMSMDTQVDMLLSILKEEVDMQSFVDQMLDDWSEGDMQGLENLLMDEFDEAPEMYKALLVDRNLNWLEQMQPMLKDNDDYLMVVGAAHMLGDDGMVKLLENQGYTVEQL